MDSKDHQFTVRNVYIPFQKFDQINLLRGLLLIFICFSFFGCRTSNPDPINVVRDFYNWYLPTYYLNSNDPSYCEIQKNAFGKFYLDTTKNFPVLRKSSFFSAEYFDSELKNINRCNSQLKSIEANHDGLPTEDLTACWFMNHIPWTGGQGEEIKSFEILEMTQEKNIAIVKVMLEDIIFIRLNLINNAWKISEIGNKHNFPHSSQ